MNDLFRYIENAKNSEPQKYFHIEVSYVELYNNNIINLLRSNNNNNNNNNKNRSLSMSMSIDEYEETGSVLGITITTTTIITTTLSQ